MSRCPASRHWSFWYKHSSCRIGRLYKHIHGQHDRNVNIIIFQTYWGPTYFRNVSEMSNRNIMFLQMAQDPRRLRQHGVGPLSLWSLQEARAAAARGGGSPAAARGSPAPARGSPARGSTAPAAAASPASRRRLTLAQPIVGERRVNAAVQKAVLAEQQR